MNSRIVPCLVQRLSLIVDGDLNGRWPAWKYTHNAQSVQFSSVQPLDRLGRRGGGGSDMKDDSAEILFQSFLQETLVSSCGMGREVHSLMLSSQHVLCRPRRNKSRKFNLMIVATLNRRWRRERIENHCLSSTPCWLQ